MNFNKDFDTNVGEILLDFLQFCKFCVENENSEMRRRRLFFFVTQSFKKKPKNVPLPQLELKHLCCFNFFVQVNHFQKVSFVYHFIKELEHKFYILQEMVNEVEFLKIIDLSFTQNLLL